MIVFNERGQDPADFEEENAAARIGHRIRRIRQSKGISLAELAEKIHISADMLQKYENGQRKPKAERLGLIAQVLGVSSYALMEPSLSSYIGVMYALFELEETYGLSMTERDGRVVLGFTGESSQTINSYLLKWYEKKASITARMESATQEEKDMLRREYTDWEQTFPEALAWKPSIDDKIREKAALERRLRELTEDLDGQ